jgi:acyl carrier protein
MTRQLNDILADTFGLDPVAITDDMGPDAIPEWDSVKHVQLVLALEAEYGIAIPVEEAMDLLSVGALRAFLATSGLR